MTRGDALVKLEIEWQRVVDSHGRTCERCELVEKQLDIAVERLEFILGALGVDVNVKKTLLGKKTFSENPGASNYILISRVPLEVWLKAKVGGSLCYSELCGDEKCRTLEVDGESYEVIPAKLIVAGGIFAAIELLLAQKSHEKGCCS